MATEDLIEARPSGDSFPESSLDDPVGSWGPPLAPTGTLDGDYVSLRHALGPATKDERFFKPLEKSDFAEPRRGFKPHRKLIARTVIPAVLGISALAVVWASTGEKKNTQFEQSAPGVQSSPQAPVQTVSSKSESPPDPSVAVAWPNLPTSVTVESPDVAPVAATENTAPRQTVSTSQKPDVVFLQRPGVNIRSTSSATGRVLGTAPKGTRFKVTNRDGEWVQVENDRLRGWIKSQFLAVNESR
jgi:hypothetical protein